MKSYTVALFLFTFGVVLGLMNTIYAGTDEVYITDPEYQLNESTVESITQQDVTEDTPPPALVVLGTGIWAVLNIYSLLTSTPFNVPASIAIVVQAPIYFVYIHDTFGWWWNRRFERV